MNKEKIKTIAIQKQFDFSMKTEKSLELENYKILGLIFINLFILIFSLMEVKDLSILIVLNIFLLLYNFYSKKYDAKIGFDEIFVKNLEKYSIDDFLKSIFLNQDKIDKSTQKLLEKKALLNNISIINLGAILIFLVIRILLR
jgi:hypothetical protein